MIDAMRMQQQDGREAFRQQIEQQIREQIREATREAARVQAQVPAPPEPPQAPEPPGRVIVPGPEGEPVVVVEPGIATPEIPPQAVDIALGFFMMVAVILIGFPIARALARRIDRRAEAAALDTDARAQLHRIEQALDAVAIEVERISEAQRYLARLESERAVEPAVLPPRPSQ